MAKCYAAQGCGKPANRPAIICFGQMRVKTASRGRQSPEKNGKQAPALRLLRELTLAAR